MAQVDRLFENRDPEAGKFRFDRDVADVFDDMILRSVPLYADVQRSIPALVEMVDHDPIRIVDLGCSTGTSLIRLAQLFPDRNVELIGVDSSPSMLEKCREKIATACVEQLIDLQLAEIEDFKFEGASVVLMNYTLQFIDVARRLEVISRIRKSLKPGGFLLVSEKVMHHQPETDRVMLDLYYEFKRRQGYSDLEIARKRDALENVLVPWTVEQNLDLFRVAGFRQVEMLLKWFNFATFYCTT